MISTEALNVQIRCVLTSTVEEALQQGEDERFRLTPEVSPDR